MVRSTRGDIFVELCVQREYLDPQYARCCINREQVARNVKHLMAFVRLAKVPVLSCVDISAETRVNPRILPIARQRTSRMRKAAFTLLPSHVFVASDNSLSVSLNLLRDHQQAIFTKSHRDPFTNPKFDRMLTEAPFGRFIVFGIPLETSVRALVLGLLRRRRDVLLIPDCCGYSNLDQAEMVLRQLGVKGCAIQPTGNFLAEALQRMPRRVRISLRSSRIVA